MLKTPDSYSSCLGDGGGGRCRDLLWSEGWGLSDSATEPLKVMAITSQNIRLSTNWPDT